MNSDELLTPCLPSRLCTCEPVWGAGGPRGGVSDGKAALPRVSQLLRPEVGSWYLIPQSAARVAKQYGEDVSHRWIVVRRDIGGQVRAMLRTSSSGWEGHGIGHDPHPEGHEAGCQIDRRGTICPPEDLDLSVFREATYSCREPDESVLEAILSLDRPPRRPQFRRHR
jgi:hypothetical protein